MSRKKTIKWSDPFQSIRGAAEITGLSRSFIYKGCVEGTIPCTRAGGDYRVIMPQFLAQLNTSIDELKNWQESF